MREGAFSFYRVQHNTTNRGWADSDLGYLVFEYMSYGERKSEKSDRIRKLLGQQNNLWQMMGEDGFLKLGDAMLALEIVRKRNPTETFRIIRVHQTKSIETIIG